MKPTDEPGRNTLSRVLRENEGVITRAQAVGCGLSPAQIRHQIRPGGPWQRLLSGVYLAVTGTPTQRQTEIAALRRAGLAIPVGLRQLVDALAAILRKGRRRNHNGERRCGKELLH